MANLGRLRFVPMIIRAYYNAQEQMAAQHTGSTNDVVKARLPMDKISTSAPVKKKGVDRPVSKKVQTSATPPSWVSNQNFARLLRELRATNRQLQGLQKLKGELKEMEIILREVNKKMVSEPPATTARTSDTRAAIAIPGTIPAARYPFR